MADIDPTDSIFEAQRQKASQQNTAQVQGAQDALKRRLAAQGNLNAGIGIKQNEIIEQQGAQNLEGANQGINAQQSQVKMQQAEAQKGRDFTASQADLQRQFLTGERQEQQKFATGERLGAQGFSSDQAQKLRDFQGGQFDQQMSRDLQKFQEEQRVNSANIDFNNRVLDKKDIFEQILGPLPGAIGGGLGSLGNFFGGGGVQGGGRRGAATGGIVGGIFGGGEGSAAGAVLGGGGGGIF